MGDEERGDAGAGEDVGNLLAQAVAQARVEARERLVEEDQLRGRRERAGQRDALLLAAGKLMRQALLEAAEVEEVDQLRHPRSTALLASQPEGDVRSHVEVREERSLLGHEPHPAPLGGRGECSDR